eukprot:IDg23430t1
MVDAILNYSHKKKIEHIEDHSSWDLKNLPLRSIGMSVTRRACSLVLEQCKIKLKRNGRGRLLGMRIAYLKTSSLRALITDKELSEGCGESVSSKSIHCANSGMKTPLI